MDEDYDTASPATCKGESRGGLLSPFLAQRIRNTIADGDRWAPIGQGFRSAPRWFGVVGLRRADRISTCGGEREAFRTGFELTQRQSYGCKLLSSGKPLEIISATEGNVCDFTQTGLFNARAKGFASLFLYVGPPMLVACGDSCALARPFRWRRARSRRIRRQQWTSTGTACRWVPR